MFIGLHYAELKYNIKRKVKKNKFPNYALMKISAWHKQNSDTIELFIPIDPNEDEQLTFFPMGEYPIYLKAREYDLVYLSKVFDFTPENLFLFENTIKGGIGYNVKMKLSPEIEVMFPGEDTRIFDFIIETLENVCGIY